MKKNLAKICVLTCVNLCVAGIVCAQEAQNSAAVTAATAPVRIAIHAGRLLDVRTGNYATNVFILVEGDPLKDIATMEHVAFVMKGGDLIKDEVHPQK